MEPADLQPQEPTTTDAGQPADVAEPSAQPTAGESGRADTPDRAAVSQGMNAFLRGTLGTDRAATSKPAEGAASGESTPDASGDVEAGHAARERGPDGKFLPRRGAAEAVRTAEQRIAELEQQLAERDPEKLRQQFEAERTVREATATEAEQARADAERYQRLQHVPDRDLSDEDYRWREEFKATLAAAPAALRAANALAERTIEAGRQALEQERDGFFNTVAGEVKATAKEYGFDVDRWQPGSGSTFRSMAKDLVEHVAGALRSRIAELERELHSARTVGPSGFGTLRVPAVAGRSDGGARSRTMNDWLRGG